MYSNIHDHKEYMKRNFLLFRNFLVWGKHHRNVWVPVVPLCLPFFFRERKDKAGIASFVLMINTTTKQFTVKVHLSAFFNFIWLSRPLLKQSRYFHHKLYGLLPICMGSLGFLSFLQCLQRKTNIKLSLNL